MNSTTYYRKGLKSKPARKKSKKVKLKKAIPPKKKLKSGPIEWRERLKVNVVKLEK